MHDARKALDRAVYGGPGLARAWQGRAAWAAFMAMAMTMGMGSARATGRDTGRATAGGPQLEGHSWRATAGGATL